MKRILSIALLMGSLSLFAKEITVLSPAKKMQVVVSVNETVSLKVTNNAEVLFEVADICMDTDKGVIPGRNAKVASVKQNKVDRVVIPEIKEKFSKIPETYNEAILTFKDKTKLQLRVYNDGVAYRFLTNKPGKMIVNNEHAEFVFDPASTLIFQEDNRVNSDYEAPYITTKIGDVKRGISGNCPALVKTPSGTNVLFLEANQVEYPCMWIKKGEKNLEAFFWQYPKEYNVKGNSKNRRDIVSCEQYIATTDGTREFPWRIFGVGETDADLLTNQLVYLLAPECKIEDPSWIKPGWVTFDWWARRGLYNVDFKAGINTETAKYMIDFAAEFGIRYFLFDDGWTYKEDLTRTIDGLNMKEVTDYAAAKNVDVLLWVTFDLFDSQLDKSLKQFSEWGIKGVKIDFINRSDQEACDFYWRSAAKCAEHKMVIDFHGAYRPDGLRRAYPNVLTREALIEFEQNGGTHKDSPDHRCLLPFIRNVAGPMDYIPGTMNNAAKKDFRFNHDVPMGPGTRAHFMAMAVVAESPMQMLPDPQPDYYREEECTRFLTAIPVEWDELIPLEAKLDDYVAMARRHDNDWYVAAITDWTPRKMELSLDFLPEGKVFTMEVFKDGINADIRGIDYKKEIREVKKGDRIDVSMAPGGGYVARISAK